MKCMEIIDINFLTAEFLENSNWSLPAMKRESKNKYYWNQFKYGNKIFFFQGKMLGFF